MYTTYFGFDSKPFKPQDLKSFYHNASFDAACSDILDGIRERRGFILLTGEVGLGKTLTLRRCMVEADDIRFVLLTNANLDFPDILSYLCASLGLPAEQLDSEQKSRLLHDALATNARRNQIIALLIDDAHHLRISVLRRLQDFVETPTIPGQRLQVVLAGLPEIEGKLRQPELSRLQESLLTRCRLDRLTHQESALFIAHQLEVVGQNADELLSPAVIERITAYCHGVPRAVAMLCDEVLLLASLDLKREITPEHVDEAARNCFLVEQNWLSAAADAPAIRRDPAVAGLPPAALSQDTEIDLNWPDLGFILDLDLEKPLAVESPIAVAAAVAPEAALESTAASSLPSSSREGRPPRPTGGRQPDRDEPTDGEPSATPREPALAAMWSTLPSLCEFIQLLEEIAAKQTKCWDTRDREALLYVRDRYLRLLRDGSPAWLEGCERRIARLVENQQPVLVSLLAAVKASPERDGVLCALLINPTWWLYREIRLRLRSPDLVFADDGQISPLRLLDGRDARPVYLSYRYSDSGPAQATLWLELDLLDHRGEWHAYDNRLEIRLDLAERGEDDPGAVVDAGLSFDRFWREAGDDSAAAAGTWLLAGGMAEGGDAGLACTLPLELETDPERTYSLRAASDRALGRGTPLTRALLLVANSVQVPTRIEIVSRPFMIFGRHGAAVDSGFGDFTLGFVPKYNRISRLHCVICALGDQLALMPASDQGYTYTGRNGQRLERGRWELLQTGDILDVCDLYRLKLTLAWDRREGDLLDWDTQEPRDRFGRYLLDLVDVLKRRDQQAGTDELRATLRNRYLNLLRMQERVAELNGVGNPGSLLYARFERMDAARRRIVHYYVPKWLSVGSSSEAGLCVNAEGVAPHHAELLFREGIYWIQNLAEPGSVRVGCHGLATNEVLALEAGDELMIGAARFAFEAY